MWISVHGELATPVECREVTSGSAQSGTNQSSASSPNSFKPPWRTAMTRSVEDIRRESENARAQFSATVNQLRNKIGETTDDIRHRVSPEGIKSEVSDFVAGKSRDWIASLKQQAMDNPMQAIAAGAAIAVPTLRLARGIPLPLLLIGAGFALASPRIRARVAEAAAPTLDKVTAIAQDRANQLRPV